MKTFLHASNRVVLAAGLCVLLMLTACSAEPYPDILPIGVIRGEVPDSGDPTAFRARLNQEEVTVRGVLHQILRWRTSEGNDAYAFVIQNKAADADGNPRSSDGLFVYVGQHPTLEKQPGEFYSGRSGDILTLRGKVNERFGQTELAEPRLLEVRGGGDVNELLPPIKLKLTDDPVERQRIFERHEGMRVKLAAGSVAVSGTSPNPRNRDMRVWVIPENHPVAARENPLNRRLFRAAHPLSHLEPEPVNRAHGKFAVIGSLGLPERMDSMDAVIPPLRAGSRFQGPLTGAVTYSWREYIIQVEDLPEIEIAPRPPRALPPREDAASTLRIASYNVENLYDFVDNPFHDCDFPTNPGCPGISPPFNYVPESDAEYRTRLQVIARQIVEELDSPEIMFIQEVENQDIGKMIDGRMEYGEVDDADGRIDALQELALEIVAAGGPFYEVTVDRDGGDVRGIICAWMYDPERLEPVDPDEFPEIFGPEPRLPDTWEWLSLVHDRSNPKAFNAVFSGSPDNRVNLVSVFSRALQLLLLRDKATGQRIWMQNNHFTAGPDRAVDRRRAQAELNAVVARAVMKLDPEGWVIVGGDMNVFPRPDDPLDPPSDQLAPLYESGLFNVIDRVLSESPETAYSYNFRGVAGTLDHFFLSPSARNALSSAAYLKFNASEPEAFSDQPPQRASDHDPIWIELDLP